MYQPLWVLFCVACLQLGDKLMSVATDVSIGVKGPCKVSICLEDFFTVSGVCASRHCCRVLVSRVMAVIGQDDVGLSISGEGAYKRPQ